jgi:hypothetical protein
MLHQFEEYMWLQEWRIKVVRELVYGTHADGNILAEARK